MDLTPWHLARDELLRGLRPTTGTEAISPVDALGRVVAAQVDTAAALPRADVAAMDGVAVLSSATPGRLRIAGDLPAGAEATPLGPGTAVHIATGAVLPPGADAVVRRERCVVSGEHVDVPEVLAGTDVRRRGDELPAGETVLRPGDVVRAGHLAVLAAGAVASLEAHRRPRVAIVVTGTEVVTTVTDATHRVPDANGPVLSARTRALGGDVVAVEHVGDEPGHLREVLAEAGASADLLLVSGGTSVGRHDHVAAALDDLGTGRAWRLALRPAKPLVTGHVHGTPVVGLPGNPHAARVSFELFARPVLERLGGQDPEAGWSRVPLVSAVDRHADGRDHVLAGHLDAGRLLPLGAVDLRTLMVAGVLAIAPDGGVLPAGTDVDVLTL